MLNPIISTAAEPSNAFVVALGMGTVFAGLVCIVILCTIMSAICNKFLVKPEKAAPTPAVQTPKKAQIANKGEVVAAIAAAIAEETGEDVSGIRILSIKQK